MESYLEYPKQQAKIPVNKNGFAVGTRSDRCDYVIEGNKYVSKKHLSIYTAEGRYIVKDEDSTNGTYVNGKKLEKGALCEIKDGDQIRLYNEEMIFHVQAEAAPEMDAAPAEPQAPIQAQLPVRPQTQPQPQPQPQPVSYDPMTGEPIYADQPQTKQQSPAQPQPSKQPISYDPMTGEPIYADQPQPISYDPMTGQPIYANSSQPAPQPSFYTEPVLIGYYPNTGEPIYEGQSIPEPSGYDTYGSQPENKAGEKKKSLFGFFRKH